MDEQKINQLQQQLHELAQHVAERNEEIIQLRAVAQDAQRQAALAI